MKELILEIDHNFENKTIKDVLFNHFMLSSSLVTSLKKGDCIKVSGVHQTVRYTLKKGDILSVEIIDTEKNRIIPKKGNLDILFEDEDILIVNKPYNMPTHPVRHHLEDTLANRVCAYLGEGFIFRAINRLDKDTTGIVLIAKNRYSAEMLNRQLRDNLIKKEYQAICEGILKEDGEIKTFICRKTPTSVMRIVSDDGKYAHTKYYPVKILGENTLLKLEPVTGRTHQLRVHLSYIGHPILGDYLYGKEILGKRPLLHCSKITFMHFGKKEEISVSAPLPGDFNL